MLIFIQKPNIKIYYAFFLCVNTALSNKIYLFIFEIFFYSYIQNDKIAKIKKVEVENPKIPITPKSISDNNDISTSSTFTSIE